MRERAEQRRGETCERRGKGRIGWRNQRTRHRGAPPSGAAGRLRRFCGCGFTMVELLVVLVIIATLLVIALP
ncbi:MAG: type II secretion system protein, partial [Armatimonadota bacterium]